MALSQSEQIDVICQELNEESNAPLRSFLSLQYDHLAVWRGLHPNLGFLYLKRAGINYLLARERKKRRYKWSDRTDYGRDVVVNLVDMLKTVQADIEVYTKANANTPVFYVPPWYDWPEGSDHFKPNQRGPAVGVIGDTVTAPPTTANGSTATLAPTGPNPTGTIIEIAEGGFAQEALPENDDRNYLRLRNRSKGTIWWQEGNSATMGKPSTELAPVSIKVLRGLNVPTGAIWIVGPVTGQQVEVAEATLEAPEG